MKLKEIVVVATGKTLEMEGEDGLKSEAGRHILV